jgi:hypothetical protein
MAITYPEYRNLCVQLLNKLNLEKGAMYKARRHASRVEWTALIGRSGRANCVELVVTSVDEWVDTWFQITSRLIIELDKLYRQGEGAIIEIDHCIFRFAVHELAAAPPLRMRSKA